MKFHKKLLVNLGLSLAGPVFFFLTLEAILSITGLQPLSLTEDPYVGYSSSQPLFINEKDAQGNGKWVTNPVKIAHFNSQSFLAKKPKGTYRIFSVGGSTAYGHPWRDPVSFSGWLRELLPKADSTHAWEVINVGGISYASYREALLIAEITKYQPDLILVYSGHNEFLEERTYRKTAGVFSFVRSLNSVLDKTRTFSGLKILIRKLGNQNQNNKTNAPPSKNPNSIFARNQLAEEVDDVLAKTIGPTSYTRNDTLHGEVLEHFQNSLVRMANLAHSVGSEILFITTPTNEKDCSPFKSEITSGLSNNETTQLKNWVQKIDSITNLNPANLLADSNQVSHNLTVLDYFDSALSIDKRNAGLLYAAGQAAMNSKQYSKAKQYFQNSIDEDICPLRSNSTMQKIVIETSEKTKALLLNFTEVMELKTEKRTGYRILGEPEFVDHVHLSIENYRLLALSIIDRMEKAKILVKGKSWNDSTIAQVTQKVMAQMGPHELGEGLHNLAKVINWAGKHQEAARIAEQALRVDSMGLEAIWSSLFVGAAKERMGQEAEAIIHYRHAVKLDTNNALSHEYLADALSRHGNILEADREYQKILFLEPANSEIRNRLQKLRADQKNSSEAIALFEAGKNAERNNKIPEAISIYAKLLSINPQHQEAKLRLSQLLGSISGNVKP